jgi:hypothetical protein
VRTADKPGTFRIKDRGGTFLLSGVRSNGQRVKIPGLETRDAATRLAQSLFPQVATAIPKIAMQDWNQTDDWGLPIRVSDATVASVSKSLGLDSLPLPVPANGTNGVMSVPAVETEAARKEKQDKKDRQAKSAKSLMEMIGIAGAAGDVLLARKLCEKANKDPVKPNPTQVNDLADSIKGTLTEWFGDRDIKPWQMMILLALGIPMTMLIQSKKKALPPEELQKQSAAK